MQLMNNATNLLTETSNKLSSAIARGQWVLAKDLAYKMAALIDNTPRLPRKAAWVKIWETRMAEMEA